MANDLEDFILDFCNAQDALVERPAFGLIDVLLPEETATRLNVDPFLRLASDEEIAAAHPDALHLTYGHPLVEQMIEAAMEQGFAVRWYINDVRLQKRDLFELIKTETTFPNAWVLPVKQALPQSRLHYYVRFNFKVTFVSDEKREELASVLMDLNQGTHARALEEAGFPAMLEQEYDQRRMSEAELAWRPGVPPLSEESLTELLSRAAQVLEAKLQPRLALLQRRAARRLELDLARLHDYYDQTEADLSRRLARAIDEGRRRGLEEKLDFVRADREHKLADVRAKHRLRVVLHLINLALIAQPKLALPIQVENRHASARPSFVYDPLLHRLEPHRCDVCGQPNLRLHLCANGHLACDEHTLHCSMCKREYCQLCEADMGQCAVCGRAICIKSQFRCPVCGQVTCEPHRGQCHTQATGLV